MQNLSFAVAFGCFLFAAHLFLARSAKPSPARFLGASFLVFAVQSALLGLRFGGWPGPAVVRPILAMTIGPLLFLSFESAAHPGFRLRARHAPHAAPALIIALELLLRRYPLDVDLAILASFAAYAAALGWRARRGPAQFAQLRSGGRHAFYLLGAAAALLGISFLTEVGIHLDIGRGTGLVRSPALLATLIWELAVIAVALVAGLMRPSPFDWMYASGGRRGAAHAGGIVPRAACAEAFARLVREERVHLEEGISLGVVARRLRVPARQLSEAINAVHGESFSRHVNRLRIEDAKRLLRDRPDVPITHVMFDSGFRTKSSFNKEFRAMVGVAPSDYRAGVRR